MCLPHLYITLSPPVILPTPPAHPPYNPPHVRPTLSGFNKALKKLSGQGRISEDNVREAMEEVRTALLEADVHLDVVKEFCDEVVDRRARARRSPRASSPGRR
jgi:hypothetical protein